MDQGSGVHRANDVLWLMSVGGPSSFSNDEVVERQIRVAHVAKARHGPPAVTRVCCDVHTKGPRRARRRGHRAVNDGGLEPARRQGPIAGEHGSHRRDVLLREAVLDDDKHVEIADPRHEVPQHRGPVDVDAHK